MNKRELRRHLKKIAASGGKVGGKSTSAAKVAAVRENGKKGGRPKVSSAERAQ